MFPVDRCLIVAVVLLAGARSKTLVLESPVTEFEESDETTPTTIINGSFENETARIQKEDDFASPPDGSLPHLGELIDKFPGEAVSEEGRTFGIKRLQFMLMPMIYKMGVMMTMLAVLIVISLKGLAIGVILLVLKLSAFFGKFYALTSHHQAPIHSWPVQPPQPVHVHVHNSGGGSHHSPYNGWESAGPSADDEHYYYKG